MKKELARLWSLVKARWVRYAVMGIVIAVNFGWQMGLEMTARYFVAIAILSNGWFQRRVVGWVVSKRVNKWDMHAVVMQSAIFIMGPYWGNLITGQNDFETLMAVMIMESLFTDMINSLWSNETGYADKATIPKLQVAFDVALGTASLVSTLIMLGIYSHYLGYFNPWLAIGAISVGMALLIKLLTREYESFVVMGQGGILPEGLYTRICDIEA